MKCPECNGTGKSKYGYNQPCIHCYGKGFAEPLTNEEWIKQCTTEQLANAFFEYRYTYATPRQKLWMSASEECIKKDIVEWLKQPHTTEE